MTHVNRKPQWCQLVQLGAGDNGTVRCSYLSTCVSCLVFFLCSSFCLVTPISSRTSFSISCTVCLQNPQIFSTFIFLIMSLFCLSLGKIVFPGIEFCSNSFLSFLFPSCAWKEAFHCRLAFIVSENRSQSFKSWFLWMFHIPYPIPGLAAYFKFSLCFWFSILIWPT